MVRNFLCFACLFLFVCLFTFLHLLSCLHLDPRVFSFFSFLFSPPVLLAWDEEEWVSGCVGDWLLSRVNPAHGPMYTLKHLAEHGSVIFDSKASQNDIPVFSEEKMTQNLLQLGWSEIMFPFLPSFFFF